MRGPKLPSTTRYCYGQEEVMLSTTSCCYGPDHEDDYVQPDHDDAPHKAQVPIFPLNVTSPSSLYLGLATAVRNMTFPMLLVFGTVRSGGGSPGSRRGGGDTPDEELGEVLRLGKALQLGQTLVEGLRDALEVGLLIGSLFNTMTQWSSRSCLHRENNHVEMMRLEIRWTEGGRRPGARGLGQELRWPATSKKVAGEGACEGIAGRRSRSRGNRGQERRSLGDCGQERRSRWDRGRSGDHEKRELGSPGLQDDRLIAGTGSLSI